MYKVNGKQYYTFRSYARVEADARKEIRLAKYIAERAERLEEAKSEAEWEAHSRNACLKAIADGKCWACKGSGMHKVNGSTKGPCYKCCGTGVGQYTPAKRNQNQSKSKTCKH